MAKAIIHYVVDDMEANEEEILLQKAKQYLSGELRGEVMTLAQQFEQKGIQIGVQQGRQEGEYSLLIRLARA